VQVARLIRRWQRYISYICVSGIGAAVNASEKDKFSPWKIDSDECN